MNKFMIKPMLFSLAASAAVALTGCGGASTTINEKASLPADDDHNHGGEPGGTALGRLLVVNPADVSTQIFDLSNGELITTVALDAQPSAVYATGGFRFAALIERNADKVGFIDGGLWQEAHDDHFDLYTTTPTLSNYSLTGSRPTHFVPHDGDVAVFLDGNTATGNNAGVLVFNDHTVEEAELPVSLSFTSPQHGVAEPRGDHLLVSTRREDAQSTSANFILPDQVSLYHLHDGSYEFEQTFDVACPDLHGAAQNASHIVFGCSDGVLLITEGADHTYTAQKITNPEAIDDGLRIGSIWGHHEIDQFIGQASAHGGGSAQYFAIDPAEGEIELIDWQPQDGATPVARDFTFEAEQFVILDNLGYLTVIEPHTENGHTHWEYGTRIDITEADVSTMPEGFKFSMTLAQNAHTVYIADPIEQHVLTVDLELLEITGDIELDYAPTMVTWLGIAESHEHDHD